MHSLAQRGRVVLDKKHGGWAGVGEYGPQRRRADNCTRIGMPTGISLFVALPKAGPIPPAVSPVAYQRIIRDRHREQDPRPPLPSTDGCVVEVISYAETKPFILRHEWLGTMGNSTATYGLRSPGGELIGAAVFGWPGAIQSRDICGQQHRGLAVCLERGACSHQAPPNAASFLISRAVRLAARDHGWRIFYAYADPEAGEIGTVYQACNWLYLGQGIGRGSRNLVREDWMIPEEGNKVISSRTLWDLHVTATQARERGWIPVCRHPKHKYVHFEGTRAERKRLMEELRYPVESYPKRRRAAGSELQRRCNSEASGGPGLPPGGETTTGVGEIAVLDHVAMVRVVAPAPAFRSRTIAGPVGSRRRRPARCSVHSSRG